MQHQGEVGLFLDLLDDVETERRDVTLRIVPMC